MSLFLQKFKFYYTLSLKFCLIVLLFTKLTFRSVKAYSIHLMRRMKWLKVLLLPKKQIKDLLPQQTNFFLPRSKTRLCQNQTLVGMNHCWVRELRPLTKQIFLNVKKIIIKFPVFWWQLYQRQCCCKFFSTPFQPVSKKLVKFNSAPNSVAKSKLKLLSTGHDIEWSHRMKSY